MAKNEFMRLREWASLRLVLGWVYDGPVHHTGQDYYSSGPVGRDTDYTAWLIRKGSVTVEAEGGRRKAGAGEWMIPTLRERHQRFEGGTEIMSIAFHASWPDGSLLYNTFPTVQFPASDYPALERTGRTMHRFLARAGAKDDVHLHPKPVSLGTYLRTEELLHRWLFTLTEVLAARGILPSRFAITDPQVLRIISLLDRRPLDQPFSSEMFARQAGLSRSQCDRVFAAHFAKTPRHYFDERRIEHACRSLRSGVAAKIVAYELGFSQLSHFSAWFTRATGESPRQFSIRHSLK